MPLYKEDSIHLKTSLGSSEVQLLLGDITHLQQDDAVDIIMVSSFAGGYSTWKPTVVGALHRELNIDVGDLARNKDVDMLDNFHCWVSKPLPKTIAYRRLVCFVRSCNSHHVTIPQGISKLFRAMTPIFNNEDTSVITPLLATGLQGHSEVLVLKAMVDCACHWIRAGLPLRCLKLVLFARNPRQLLPMEMEVIDLFRKLKRVYEAPNFKQKEEEQSNDVFISYSRHDNHLVDMIYKQLREIRPTLRVMKKQMEFSVDKVWQDNIFHVMMQSKRIIVILSPSYVQSPECLEQFNMALCVNRLSAHHQICPMYVDTVPTLPSYMQLVQYVDCRNSKYGILTQTRIKDACLNLLSHKEAGEKTLAEKPVDIPVTDVKYDVFISYSHRNPAAAERLLKYFQETDPDLNVFFDKSQLKTGSLWQQTLYSAIDNSHCVVTLLSPAYVQSDVCQEEYNIALNRALAGREVFLIPICMEGMETVPKAFSHIPILDGYSSNQDGVLRQVTLDVLQLVRSGTQGQSIVKPYFFVQPLEAQETYRKQEFYKYFQRVENTIVFKSRNHQTQKTEKEDAEPKNKYECDVVISFSHDSLRLAFILSELISRVSRNTKCKFISENNKERLHLLDQSRFVVILMSDSYVQSSQLLEELHLSLCRQRRDKSSPMVYLIQAMHLNPDPFHLHLIRYQVGIMDKLWTALIQDSLKPNKGELKISSLSNDDQTFVITRKEIKGTYTCSPSERLALSKAALEITDILDNRSHTISVETNIVNMGNLHTEGDEFVPLQKCLKQYSSVNSSQTDHEQETDKDSPGHTEGETIVTDTNIKMFSEL